MLKINEEVSRCIKSIGQDLINRADDIARDIKQVTSIEIKARINREEIINYDVTKNYIIKDYIHYDNVKKVE